MLRVSGLGFRLKVLRIFANLNDLGKAPGLPQTIDNLKKPSVSALGFSV